MLLDCSLFALADPLRTIYRRMSNHWESLVAIQLWAQEEFEEIHLNLSLLESDIDLYENFICITSNSCSRMQSLMAGSCDLHVICLFTILLFVLC